MGEAKRRKILGDTKPKGNSYKEINPSRKARFMYAQKVVVNDKN